MLIAWVGCVFGCSGNQKAVSENPASNTQPSSVQSSEPIVTEPEYAALLSVVGNSAFVIEDRTKGDFLGSDATKIFSGLLPETIKDFNEKNSIPVSIECKFPPDSHCTLLSRAEIKNLWNFDNENATDKWDAFKAKYGTDHYYTTSRIGFSNDRSQGLVFVSSTCGSTCADGTYYFLVQENGRWKVTDKKRIWVS